MLAHITGEGRVRQRRRGHLARPRRHFQSHDRRQQSREEGSGWVGWRQLVPLLRRRRNEQEPRLFPLSSLGGGWTHGRRARQKVEESNQLCSSSFYSFLLRSSVRAGEALYRRYSSSVFLACITERFSQHFTFLPVRTLSTPSAARATKMTLTRSRGMSTRARRIPIHFHLVSPEEQ